jgi:energy-coupling factor transporter ATP-binding protein EcfA2
MNPPQDTDPRPDAAPELTALLAQPGNQVTLRALMAAMSSENAPIVVVGADRNPQRALRGWSEFIAREARTLDIYQESLSDFELEKLIVSATSQLYLDDAVELTFGRDVTEAPVRRSLDMIPYLAGGRLVVVAEEVSRDLQLSFRRVDLRADAQLWSRSEFQEGMLRYYVSSRDDFLLLSLRSENHDLAKDGRPSGAHQLIELVSRRELSLLFFGLPPDDVPLLDALKEWPRTGPHFALLNSEIRSQELIRYLYARNIRPIWYEPNSTQLEYMLVRMAESIAQPALSRPPIWPVRPEPSNMLAAVKPAPPNVAESVADPPSDPPLPGPSPPQDVVDACLRNECIAFVGSGISARAGLPTWRGFVEGLVEEAVTQGLMSRDAALHQRAAMKVGEINAVADNVTSAFSQKREALLAYYRAACTPADGVQPAIFAQLRKIPFAGILTTNYDDLLSQANADIGSLQRLTPRDSEQLLAMLSSGDQRFLLKLYGNLDQSDSVIFSPSDYQDLVRSNVAFSRFIEGLFFSRTMLFLGTSLEGLVDYLGAFRFPSGVPRKHYALIAVSGAGWQAMAQTLKRRYNIEVLPYTVSPAFSELDTFLAELVQQTANTVPVASPSTVESGPRLQRVELHNIGPFKHLVLEFKTLWKVLLGDNGVGKSTILKSIAVAIVGSEGRQYAGRLLRAGEAHGSVTLVTQKNPSGYVAEIQRVGLEAEVVTRSGRVLETEGWVALAFPPLRATSWVSARGPQGVGARYPTAADLLPMLSGEVDSRMDDLKQWLVNVDALSRKEGAAEDDRARATRMLGTFFEIVRSLTEGLSVRFKEVTTDFRVLVETPDGVVPIEALSQGLTSLLSWIGIVVQRLYEVTPIRSDADDAMRGYALILMDEIDAHMHPSWQQQLLAKLKELLPNVQVIATTHSPLVVAGLEVEEVTRFIRDETGAVVQVSLDRDMTEGRTDQILTGDLFGLHSTFALAPLNASLMEEYKVLLGKSSRTVAEQQRFIELDKMLQANIPPASAENKLERRAQELVHAVLEADYSSKNRDKLRNELLGKTRAVARSMGWTEMLGSDENPP